MNPTLKNFLGRLSVKTFQHMTGFLPCRTPCGRCASAVELIENVFPYVCRLQTTDEARLVMAVDVLGRACLFAHRCLPSAQGHQEVLKLMIACFTLAAKIECEEFPVAHYLQTLRGFSVTREYITAWEKEALRLMDYNCAVTMPARQWVQSALSAGMDDDMVRWIANILEVRGPRELTEMLLLQDLARDDAVREAQEWCSRVLHVPALDLLAESDSETEGESARGDTDAFVEGFVADSLFCSEVIVQ